jgi:hypothetical protein
MAEVRPHTHSIADVPVGTGANQIPLATAIRSGLLEAQIADSDPVANTTDWTAFGGAGLYTLPANTLQGTNAAPEVLRVILGGEFELGAGSNITLRADVGGTVRSTTPAVAAAAGFWRCALEITQYAGNAARLLFKWSLPGGAAIDEEFTEEVTIADFDPTAANAIQLAAQWSVADPGNVATQKYRTVERLAIFGA